jgi:hypothetical protein
MLAEERRPRVTAHLPDASPRVSPTGSDSVSIPGAGLFRSLARGVAGGLIATVLMTLYRFPVFRALPPTAEFWATYVGGGAPRTHFGTGLVLHFLYGGAAGGLFGVVIDTLGVDNDGKRSLGVIVLSLAYGLALSAFGTRFVFQRLLDEELDPNDDAIFHAGHAIYGLTLGTWLSFDERLGDAYE